MQMRVIKRGTGYRKRNLWRRQAQMSRVLYRNHKFGEIRWWFDFTLHTEMMYECVIKDVVRGRT